MRKAKRNKEYGIKNTEFKNEALIKMSVCDGWRKIHAVFGVYVGTKKRNVVFYLELTYLRIYSIGILFWIFPSKILQT